MRKIGAHVSTAGGLLNAVKNTREIGGNCMQIFAGSPRTWARSLYATETARAFRETVEFEEFNPVYIHALYLTNLASDVDDLRRKSKEALVIDMKNAALIGARGVILHIGSHQGRGFDSVAQTLLGEIGDVLAQTPVAANLILENSAGQNGKIGTLEELKYLVENLKSDRIKVCLDTAHAFASGHDLRDSAGVERLKLAIDNTFGLSNLEVLHLNDSKAPLGSGRDLHENIGAGMIGKEGLQLTINNSAFADLPVILEVPGFDKKGPDQDNIAIVKTLVG